MYIYPMDKFRVISDLHLDINKSIYLEKDDIFTVIAGDISGKPNIFSFKLDVDCNKFYINADTKQVLEYLENKNKTETILTYNKHDDTWIDEDGNVVTEDECDISVQPKPYRYDPISFKNENVPDGTRINISYYNKNNWLREHISKGVFVEGNHIGYNYDGFTVDELKQQLTKEFPLDSDITFLDESIGVISKEVDGILFVGTTLYTDYKYVNKESDAYGFMSDMSENDIIYSNMRTAFKSMNDFKLTIKEYDENDDIVNMSPLDYLEIFKKSIQKIKEVVEKNKDKEVVVVTHHCPSPKCISRNYVSSNLNASYVSDLEDFITSHENIKCWVCGHVHHQNHFKIGNCLVVMNPVGYKCYKEDINFEPNLFVNTKSWEIEKN